MEIKENLDELFFGGEAAEKINKLKSGLLEIEENHQKYFEEKKGKFIKDECDKLHNHCITITNSGEIIFGFINDSDLHENIRKECIKLFSGIFIARN
jgi:hypothetical protein